MRTTAPSRTSTTISPADVQGERFQSQARLVIAPTAGVFEQAGSLAPGSIVRAGQVVGHLTSGPVRTEVVSPFAGTAGAALAWTGERLTSHQPVMWLSADVGAP